MPCHSQERDLHFFEEDCSLIDTMFPTIITDKPLLETMCSIKITCLRNNK